jgi:hypothetical protein
MRAYAISCKCMMVSQNYTSSEKILVGPYSEIYAACYDANQAINIKDEEDVLNAKEEEDPTPITIQEIKIEPEVSCMPLYVSC